MDKKQLRELVEKVLKNIDLYSEDAVELILGTIAQESRMGMYLKQINGPALGICQIEPFTFVDLVENFLIYKPFLKSQIRGACNMYELKCESMIYNLAFSIAMCRVFYLRVQEPLPTDLAGHAKYWKQHYNTKKGKGTEKEFIDNYKKYVL